MGTYEQAKIGEACSSGDPKILTQLVGMNELLNSENKLGKTLRWMTPSVQPGESNTAGTSFATLLIPDEVKNVVLPSNGLIAVGYVAKWQSSVAGAGRAAVFLGTNQIKRAGAVTEAKTESSPLNTLTSIPGGLGSREASGALSTTGETVAYAEFGGGLTYIFAAAGTYNVSVQFRVTSGEVNVKERTLWVGVIGS